ncbi:MAG: hypothetical protein LUC43_00670, partial [Burkholderiales bacterium]|nr:hypothetical protein [Burkholderiales bacterium]
GCGASKPPLPSGSRIAVTQWAAQFQEKGSPQPKKEISPTPRTIPLEPDYLSTFEAPNEGDWP